MSIRQHVSFPIFYENSVMFGRVLATRLSALPYPFTTKLLTLLLVRLLEVPENVTCYNLSVFNKPQEKVCYFKQRHPYYTRNTYHSFRASSVLQVYVYFLTHLKVNRIFYF